MKAGFQVDSQRPTEQNWGKRWPFRLALVQDVETEAERVVLHEAEVEPALVVGQDTESANLADSDGTVRWTEPTGPHHVLPISLRFRRRRCSRSW